MGDIVDALTSKKDAIAQKVAKDNAPGEETVFFEYKQERGPEQLLGDSGV